MTIGVSYLYIVKDETDLEIETIHFSVYDFNNCQTCMSCCVFHKNVFLIICDSIKRYIDLSFKQHQI